MVLIYLIENTAALQFGNCLMYVDRLSPVTEFPCTNLSPSISGDLNLSPARLKENALRL